MRIKISFVVLLFMPCLSWAVDAEFLGYLRGGTGLNFEGGKQECFFNAGIPGNFLRLGNECSFYSELIFVFNHQRPTQDDPFYMKTQIRLALGERGTRAWEPAANRTLNQVEAFVMAGGIAEIPGDVWIGKRFYRDVDLHIFDWYYYAEMSGVGAGIENLPVGAGTLALAHLIQTNEEFDTTVGRPVLQAFDVRWKDIPAFGQQKLNLWTVYAWAPASKTTTEEFRATNGYTVSSRLSGPWGSGNNNFSVMFGKGAMKDFNIYANSALPINDDSQNKAWALRFVEDWNYDVTDHWAFLFGAAAEQGSNGKDIDDEYQWQQVGFRPVYFVSDRIQWVMEMGASRINVVSEKETNGAGIGDRTLARITLSPQLALKKSIWGRPVMRIFLSHSMWNDQNKSFIAQEAPTFLDKSSGTSFGYQFEAWF